MRQLYNKNLLLVFLFCMQYQLFFAQCTEAKDSEMAKYKNLTLTQDAQGCSQCAMLALYFCSARYCVEVEDKRKVGALISECKQNIRNMGQPYCCPEYLTKNPEWGIMAGSSTQKGGSTASSSGMLSGSSTGIIPGPSLSNTGASSDLTGQLLQSLVNLDGGKSASLTNYAASYAQGQQLAEVATGIIDLFTPSPEEKARREKLQLEEQQRAQAERERLERLRIENENKAKAEFEDILKRYKNGANPNSHNYLVISIMDNYLSNKYNLDLSAMLPEWSNWMQAAIEREDNFATTVFAGKALGFNYNKFNYSLKFTIEQAIKLLEKVSGSEDKYAPYLGVNFGILKKNVQEKNAKKKTISKSVDAFMIKAVTKGSAAEKAELKENDILLKYNGNYTDNLAEEISKSKVGEKVKITLLRDDKEMVKEITLGKIEVDNQKIDAMILLANYYNTKSSGNNPEKALYYFTKAAENGSPNAMYALGEIYKKNTFGNKKVSVKYKFKKNEEFALEWYLKSIQNPYYSSSRHYNTYKIGNYFEPAAFDEIIEMYQKGMGCEKSKEKANEIIALKNEYVEKSK